MKLSSINESELPFRNRVEVFAVRDGKLYCGEYEDGTIGVFGGGTDGESLEDAASREFNEETGYKVNNLTKVPVGPIEVLWDKPKSEKQKERSQNYKGTRTWYYVGEFDDSCEKDKASGEDGQHNLKNVSLRNIDDKLIEKFISDINESLAKQQKARADVIRWVIDNYID
jgi:8-oxo-dGTP pyrophosphatase MutT (NUDIX family)